MIVAMKKVSLIVLNKEKKEALTILRKAGVMHIDSVNGSGADLATLKNNLNAVNSAFMTLSDIKAPKGAKKIAAEELTKEKALEKALEINALVLERKKCEELVLKNTRDLERFAKWGNINPEDFAFLKEKGIPLTLYEIPPANYYDIPEEISTVLVNEDKNKKRFVAFGSETGKYETMPAEAVLVQLPEKSSDALKAEIKEAEKQIEGFNQKLVSQICYAKTLKENAKKWAKDVEFENIYSGMENDGTDTDSSLAWLTGFVPEPEFAELKKTAEANSWALMAEDPTEEDNVPTKLKNNKAVEMLYPVLDFMGTFPGYWEYDVSIWFLLFLTIFFGMIFGDAGYGLLLLFAGLFAAFKAKKAKKTVAPVITLLIVWASTTVVWGVLNCSWFGMDYKLLPKFLQNLALPVFAPANPERDTNLQIFCFLLALAQLSIGHFIAMKRNFKEKSLKVLADIGSLFILWGMFYVVLMLIVSSERFPLIMPVPILIAVGFVLSFIFSNYEGSIGKSIVESCKNIISVLLGVINFFSDIVSYIRLWAVALAGTAIAETVNTMAGPMLGNFLIFFGIILLVFGHGLNMVLNVLSVIVHGVRLNTLEFTSHVGMNWAGFKYEPFRE